MHKGLKKVLTASVIVCTAIVLAGCGQTGKTEEAMKLIQDLDYQSALNALNEASSLDEEERLISRGRGIAYMGLTDYSQAIDCFKESLAASNGMVQNLDFDLNYYLAAAYYKSGDYQSAKSVYDAILALKPKEKKAYFLRGNVLLELGDFDSAKEDFDRVVAMEPNNYDRIISIYEAMEQKGHKTTGQDYLRAALGAGEKQMSAFDCGRFYYFLEDYQKAYIALEEAKTKGGADSYLYLGKAYEATGDFNYAASVYNSYLGKEGGDARMYNQLGMCEIKRLDYRKALEAFQAGLKLEGNEGQLQDLSFNEIVALEYLGEFDQAKVKIKDYLRKFPDDQNAKREEIFLSTR